MNRKLSVMINAEDVAPVLNGMRSALDFQRRALVDMYPDLELAYDYADLLSGGLHILESMTRGTAIADYWQDLGMEEYGDDKRLHYRRRIGEGSCNPLPSEPFDSEFDGEYGPTNWGRSADEDREILSALQSL